MDRTRIRWSNVGRLLGGVGAGGLLLVVVPGLIEPSDPPPLPADVGLASGATGAYVSASPAAERDRDRHSAASELDRDRRLRRSRPSTPERRRPERPPERPPARPSAEAPPVPAPPVPAPVTAPAPPPPPAEPPPADEPDPTADQQPPAHEPTPPPSPSQFGFEH